jgi:transmembrane sensor
MPRAPKDTPEDMLRLAEASAWRVTLSEQDLESCEAFETWLTGDAGNAVAWARTQASWSRFGDEAVAPEMMTARRDALERARQVQARRAGGERRSLRVAGLAAAAVAAVLVAGGAWWLQRPAVYSTALGERRTVMLADGSRMALDSGTKVRVRLLRDARRLTLVRGQARFDVAHDVMRPFSVAARNQVVVATGTSFNVDLLGPKVTVTLIEGRVSVLQNGPGDLLHPGAILKRSHTTRLRAGQELVAVNVPGPVVAAPAPTVEKVNLDGATAWENGQLVFDNEPLATVVERVGRYSNRTIGVADARTGALRISGVFNAGDLDTFVDTLQRYLPVEADHRADGGLVLRQR